MPTKEGHFILDTDSSEFAMGAELMQIQDGQERIISYASIALLPEQKRYCTTRKELLAVVTFIVIICLEDRLQFVRITVVYNGYSTSVTQKVNLLDGWKN